jgi:hypothetical protein
MIHPAESSSTAGLLRTAGRFVRDAFGRCSWALVAAAVLVGVVRLFPLLYGALLLHDGRAPDVPFRSIEVAIAVACILGAVLLAEQGGRASVPRVPAYVLALALASICTAFLTGTVWESMCGHGFVCDDDSTARYRFTFIALGTFFYGCLAGYLYANREQMLRSMRDVGDAQLERAQAERALAQTRLQRLQAQVDPDLLLDELRRVYRLYEERPAEAAATLDALIEQLRSATRKVSV